MGSPDAPQRKIQPTRVRRSAAKRIASGLLGGTFTALSLVLTSLAGLVLHLDLPATRRVIAESISRVYSSQLLGSLEVEGLDKISTGQLRIERLRLYDPKGNAVITLNSVRARADLLNMAYEGLFGDRATTLIIDHIRAESTIWHIIPEQDGSISLANAFLPRPKAQSTSKKPSKPSREIRVWIPTIELGPSIVRADIPDVPRRDITVTGAQGVLLSDSSGLKIDVKRFGATVKDIGGADAEGTGELNIRAPGRIWLSFNGHLADIQVNLFAMFRDGKLETKLELPRVNPESVRPLFPAWPLNDTINLRVDAAGELPQLDARITTKLGDADFEIDGALNLGDSLGGRLKFDARKFNIQGLVPSAPKTRIDLKGNLEVWQRGGEFVLDINATTQPTRVEDIYIPLIDWNGSLDSTGFRGKTAIHEPGIPIAADFHVHPSGKIDLDVRARRFALRDSPRLRSLGSGFVELEAKASIENGQIVTQVNASGSQLAAFDTRFSSLRLDGTLQGPIANPEALRINSRVRGQGFQGAGLSFDEVGGRVAGRLYQPKVEASLSGEFKPTIKASAQLFPPIRTQTTRLTEVQLSVERGDTLIRGEASRVAFSPKNIQIADLLVSGAGGQLAGSADISKEKLVANIQGNGVDLATISQALGLPKNELGGNLNIDANVVIDSSGANGRFAAALGNASLRGFRGLAMRVEGELKNSEFAGRSQVIVENIGRLGAEWRTALAGDPTEAESWLGATGVAVVNTSHLDLEGLREPLRSAGVDDISGNAAINMHVLRELPSRLPDFYFTAGTSNLALKFHTENKETKQKSSYHLTDIDVQMAGQVQAQTGRIQTTARILDSHGELISASVGTQLDLSPLISGAPEQLIEQLATANLSAELNIPTRNFSELPLDLQPSGIEGRISARAALRGTLQEPSFETQVFATSLRQTSSPRAQPFNVNLNAGYRAKTSQLTSNGTLTIGAQTVATASSLIELPWESLKVGKPGPEHWKAIDLTLRLNQLPIESFAPFADNHIEAKLDGSIAIKHTEKTKQVHANIAIHDPVLDRVSLGAGVIDFRSDGEQARASIELKDDRSNLQATAFTGISWDALLPSLDARNTIRVDLNATNYDAVILQPFVSRVMSQVSGRVDGQFTAMIHRRAPAQADEASGGAGVSEEEWSGTLTGEAAVQKGRMLITNLGLELEDVRFGINATSDGSGTSIEMSQLRGKVRSEADNVVGSAKFYLDGFSLTRGAGNLRINSVPLLLEGVNQGVGTGYATFRMEKIPEGMRVDLSIPDLEVRLPRSSTRSVYDIEDNPDIEIIQLAKQESEAEEPTLWLVPITLGSEVRITRSDLEIYVRGEPTLRMLNKVGLEGFIELVPGGRIPTLGKNFVIEQGTVSFDTGEPTNPHLNVTASLRTADNTIIYVDVLGKLNQAELKLRSDPPLAEPEIIALMLGGVSTTGEEQQGPSDAETTGGGRSAAVNIGGGVAAIGLNELLAGTPLGGVELRTDSTSRAAPSYTAAYRASSKVYVEGTYQAADNSGIDDRVREGFTGTVDYRFLPNWSLRTQLGNTGTALDLIWQYRY